MLLAPLQSVSGIVEKKHTLPILSNVLLWIEVTFFSVSKTIAPIVNLLVTIPLNFIINKLWTFKER